MHLFFYLGNLAIILTVVAALAIVLTVIVIVVSVIGWYRCTHVRQKGMHTGKIITKA